MARTSGSETGGRRQGTLSRREFLKVAGAGAAAAGGAVLSRYVPGVMAAPASRAISGDIVFATFEWTLPHTGSVLRGISQSFTQKYPNARVREVPTPSTGYHDQMLTQLIAGTPPDLLRIDDPQLQLYIDRGFLEPLDDYIKEANIDTSRFMAAMKDAQRGGKTYAVVYQTNARQLIYNNQLLADAGLSGLPKNAAEFEEYIRRSTRRDRGVFGYTFASKAGDATGMFLSLGPIIIGFGSHFTTPDGKPNATDPRVVEALKLIKRMWDGDHVPRGLDGPGANALIFRGSVALSLNGPFVFGAAAPEVRPHLFAVPSPLPSKTVMRATGWYGVTTKGRNKEAAAAWLMHMLTPENQTRIVERERVCPALPHLVSPDVWKDDPWFKAFVEGAQRGVTYLPPGLGPKAFDQIKVIGDEIERILYRGKPVEQAVSDLQKSMEASLK